MSGNDAGFAERCHSRLAELDLFPVAGRVHSVTAGVIQAEGLKARVGSVCAIEGPDSPRVAEVVGFRDRHFLLMPLGDHRGIEPGARIRLLHWRPVVPAGEECLGRVVDALGRPIDGRGPLNASCEVPLYQPSEPALARRRLSQPLDVGVRAINGLLTLARGSRAGIFAGSGIGKSTLLGQIARFTSAEVNVVALVGERSREVREFVERDLGEGLRNSVVVVATSDEAPLLRVRAAHTATTIAEHFRQTGREVLLLMDSLTRFCTAQREIGLSAGEPPATRGYPPSVWSALPRLLERAGTRAGAGSVTGIYTVLVEGDDPHEPVADAARSLLDAHIVLSRELAERGQFPPIDPVVSASRVMTGVVSPEHMQLARLARESISTHRRFEDLIAIGAYRDGSDPSVDRARRLEPSLRRFMVQEASEGASIEDSLSSLARSLDGAPS